MARKKGAKTPASAKRRLAASSAILVSTTLLLLGPFVSLAHAQTQMVTASPGYINLGMSTSISVTAPAAGQYTVVVAKPNGASASLPFTFASAGQTQNATFGNATSGFGSAVSSVGTYNVFVEQGSQVVGTTSFYATDKLVVTMDMVNGGDCTYVGGVTRGEKMFPRFSVSYASNGQPLSNDTAGISVSFTAPNSAVATAAWDSGAHLFVGRVLPNWNYTSVGAWSPTANVTTAAGNVGTFVYSGSPFQITPAQLSTAIQLVDAKTGKVVTSVYSGENLTIKATITYPTNAEPVTGFVGPLDTATRGGVVSAQVGYGYYNDSALTFGGGAKSPGTLIATIPMAYTGANGTWAGSYVAGTLPTLPAGELFQVVIASHDSASPPNTGLGSLSVGPSLGAPGASSSSSTTTSAPSTSTLTTTVSQVTQTVPTVAYAGMVILLALGLIIGLVLRMRR